MKRNRRGLNTNKLYVSVSPENYNWLHEKSNTMKVSKSLLMDILINRVRELESNDGLNIETVVVEMKGDYE